MFQQDTERLPISIHIHSREMKSSDDQSARPPDAPAFRKTFAMPTDKLKAPKMPRLFSLSASIAWLSLVLLAAAWGRTLDERWQGIWIRVGAFGLTAAVGLGGLEKARLIRDKHVRDLAARISDERLDGRLTRLNEQSAALDLIDNAIRRLTRHVASERQIKACNPDPSKIALPLNSFPLEVIPVKEHGEAFDIDAAHSIAGSLHGISSRVFSFEHDHAFSEHVVLLKFALGNRDTLCFVVDVLWTHVLHDRFVSSGATLAAGVPVDQVAEMALVESI
jgi:hypothetical protein